MDRQLIGDGTYFVVDQAGQVSRFFVHPDFARQGVGRAILAACEVAILAACFQGAERVATLAGEPL